MNPALSGWLLAIGGASAAIGWTLFALLDPEHERRSDPTWLGFNLPIILGGLLITLGLTGFLADQGPWETAAILAAAAGFAISHLGVHSLETATDDVGKLFVVLVSIALPLLVLGGLGFGVVLLADSALPAWIGVVVIAGVLAGVATNFINTSDAVSRGWVPALGSASLAVVGAARLLSL